MISSLTEFSTSEKRLIFGGVSVLRGATYRPEIDGLRAIAVVPVVVFHFHLGWLEGGFYGVDVFFVISGYLITSILLKELSTSSFSLVSFYERRARRILPALFVMMLVCIPFAYALLLPYQVIDFSESVLSTLFFFSNFLFMFESGYFQSEAQLKPLLHTWSLSVEEQFYLIFPVVLALLWRFGRRLILAAMAVVFLLSLASAEILAAKSASMNFFFTPSRAFELLLGAFAAFAHERRFSLPKGIAEAGSFAGLLAILVAYTALADWGNVPGLATLVPTGGAFLIIFCATPQTAVGKLLSHRAAVGIGLISYSLYLWHWPIFVFAHHMLGAAPGPVLSIGLAFLALGVAYLSWRFVERPFRTPGLVSRRAIVSGASFGAAGLAVIAIVGVLQAGFIDRYPPEDRHLAQMAPGAMGKGTDRLFRSLENKPFDDVATTPNILVVGDSYAMDYMNMVAAIGELDHASFSTRHIHGFCGVLYTDKPIMQNIPSRSRPECVATMPLFDAATLRRVAQADRVVLASSWRPWVVELLPETVENLRAITDADIQVIGTKFFSDDSPVRELLALDDEGRKALRSEVPEVRASVNARMRSTLADSGFVDIFSAVCRGEETCPVVAPNGDLISFDGNHLTLEGARYVGEVLSSQISSGALRKN